MPAEPVDDAGRRWPGRIPPQRIVSLVPSVTELVCDLGGADRLVGVTRFCTHPPEIVAVTPDVGGTKNPDLAAIERLRPDVVLMNIEENREEDFRRLDEMGIPLFVSFTRTVHDTAGSVRHIGALLQAKERAEEIAGAIDRALDETPRLPDPVPLFCPIWKNPWMSVNRDIYVHDLLERAGGRNLCAEATERYPTVDLEEIAARAPQVILLPSEPYRFTTRHLTRLGPLAETPAARRGRVHLVDGQALTWYGARTAGALRHFHALIGR